MSGHRVSAFTTSLVVLLAAAGLNSRPLPAQQTTASRSLFDGKSLDGWEGDPDYWRVEDAAIVGEIPAGQTLRRNTWLIWKDGELRDFDLQLQFRLRGAPAANSGIQFRCQARDIHHVSGYQADLDLGATWLGRIYDEHGRALLVERGSRVAIDADGSRTVETFAPAGQYAVLFREDAWNDYRITAIGDHVAVYINGTLFSELRDRQTGEADRSGQLALQLHSGPETRVEFRRIRLEPLSADDERLPEFRMRAADTPDQAAVGGVAPADADGQPLNLSFEQGTLDGWTASGNAFDGQPVRDDGIAARWPGQVSNKHGEWFVGGYEHVRDGGVGTLTSRRFVVTHPWASFLLGGGSSQATRVEILHHADDSGEPAVILSASGRDREQMERVVVDLRTLQNEDIAVRLVDDSRGGWGHLNFDDFRFHADRPQFANIESAWRSIRNPILQHLVPNPAADAGHPASDRDHPSAATTAQMHVPPGFSVDLIAAEPQLHQPMAFTFDARGRLWVVEGHSYPQKRPEGEGQDRILIFTDEDADGHFEQRSVFIEGLNLVSGLEVGFGGVWVGAAPDLLFIPDRDHDDRPDSDPQVLLDGFGYADTHETLNSFLWGPDGWLYGNQGVFNSSRIGPPGAADDDRVFLSAGVWRYHPVRHVFEVFAHGGSNQWGLDYDSRGALFMTHCRSYWGRGATTHVMPGGHYWNQVNSGHAAFVSPRAPDGFPELQSFLLASARYGHGEGGAGKRGSRAVFGGHSHVGTMIYLGDNWPGEYRDHLFTHNLHGHQINHQINVRDAGGFHTVHAGRDMLFCADPQYIGVDLQYGPDGAVYISDWYDPRHCHNPDVEQWDRGNGRIYRMKYDATWKPAAVHYRAASDSELAEAQLHGNEWHVRTARRVLQERAADAAVAADAVRRLRDLAREHPSPERRLRALWTLFVINQADVAFCRRLLQDPDEFVRGWAVRLLAETAPEGDPAVADALIRTADDDSLVVCRELASAIPRLSRDTAWSVCEVLARRSDLTRDRDLPGLLWFGLAHLMDEDLSRGLQLAATTPVAALRNRVHWYAARSSANGREQIVEMLAKADSAEQSRLLTLLEFAVRGMRGLPRPAGWSPVAERLYDHPQQATRQRAESIGAAFGDEQLYAAMRNVLVDCDAGIEEKRHALAILESDSSDAGIPALLALLDSPPLVERTLPLLARHNHPKITDAVLERLPSWDGAEAAAAMELLSSRAESAIRLLDAIAAGHVADDRLTAWYARKMVSLNDPDLNARLDAEWGALGQSSEERRAEIRRFTAEYQSAPLWAYSEKAGAEHFRKLCASCHEPTRQNAAVAPKLAGSGSKGIAYLAENVIDPNAVIGRDFQARVIVTTAGQVITGLVESETETAVTIRTLNDRITIARDDIEETQVSRNSFMPEKLLRTLNDRERIELFKYLMSL